MNKWEEACKEFLKGCTCSEPNKQEECEECLKAFCNYLRKKAIEDKYEEINKNCINA